ncbi:MAG: NADH-quinone oxidoreductase subunit NuoG [Actinomycetota bacterium]|nr:NADH-quinone oxidoreductase subunit NuoG [Actinomycetota bacterium]
MSQNGPVTLSINGQEVQADKGRLLIDVAEEHGVFVPRFCYHPGMKSVAVCRMCLVNVEGQRKLVPACATPVDEGMVVATASEDAVDAQRGMLEFLLINHPLDCPICDRAGECPLQDQTYKHGPGSSRYIEPKRSFEKALDISELVVLDRERCVLCWRCVRFADEVAGDSFIELVDRGAGTQILTFSDEPFDSYFSGNTVQICPVGALTARPYRFQSRPWNLESSPSVCTYCSVGCPITNEARAQKMVRCQALPNEEVNGFWNCDKGRFGYHHVNAEDRLDTPLVREGSEFAPVSWGRALAAAAEKLTGKDKVGVIAGGHLTTEDAFAVAKLAKGVIGTPHVDSRIQDAGVPYERAIAYTGAAGSNARISDLDTAATIVWVGADPKESLPVLYLRLRQAVVTGGAKLIVVSPRRLSLDAIASEVIRAEAGGEVAALGELARRSADLKGPTVLCWSQGSAAAEETSILDALFDLGRELGDARLLMGVPHAGSQGMLDMGVHPALDAGYAPASATGRDTQGILEAAAAGELDTLLIVGADPIADFPDQELARRALSSKVFTIVVELFPTETVEQADVVLPSAAYAEREGTFTNLERRIQKLEKLLDPPGTAQEPWRTCAGLARELDADWGWRSFDDVWADLKKEVPGHSEVDLVALRQELPSPGPVYETGFAPARESVFASMGNEDRRPVVAGPGAEFPKGYRSGAPFQTGQNWPLSWEIREFEGRQRTGFVPPLSGPTPPAPSDGSADPAGGERPQSEGFVLYSGRHIYDEGAMVSRSSWLRNLQKDPFVEMSPEDAADLGVGDGDQVILRAGEAHATLPVRISDIARGALYVPYDQKGFKAASLAAGGGRVEVARA